MDSVFVKNGPFKVNGTAVSGVTIRGTDASNRMYAIQITDAAYVEMFFTTVNNMSNRFNPGLGSRCKLFNCNITTGENGIWIKPVAYGRLHYASLHSSVIFCL